MLELLFITAVVPPDPAPALHDAVEQAMELEHGAAITALRRALADVEADPPFSTSRDGRLLIIEALLLIARLHLAQGDELAATRTIEELIRFAGELEPPVREYGGQLTRLYEARKQALEQLGTASVRVSCAQPCRVVVAGRRALDDGTVELLLGSYRVWISGSEHDSPWSLETVELREVGAVVTIEYGPVAEVEPELGEGKLEGTQSSQPPTEQPARPGQRSVGTGARARAESTSRPASASEARAPDDGRGRRGQRMLSRGTEIAGMVAGAGLLVAGGVLLGLDARCWKTLAPGPAMSEAECGPVVESSVGGATLSALGGGVLLVSGVMLSIDEVRVGRARAKLVMAGVTLKF